MHISGHLYCLPNSKNDESSTHSSTMQVYKSLHRTVPAYLHNLLSVLQDEQAEMFIICFL